ncbi:MAG: type III pantothenate kinase [Gemmataceae bacterium]
MTPDVVVDVGNSRIKWGRVAGGTVAEMVALPPDDPAAWDKQAARWKLAKGTRWAMAGVQPTTLSRLAKWCRAVGGTVTIISGRAQVPLTVAIKEPDSVGVDRLLNALAAKAVVPRHTPAVIVSVGTAVTVDLLDARGRFAGGAIFPGPQLMATALHQHTAKLPEIEIPEIDLYGNIGQNTAEAIEMGVGSAVLGGIDLTISSFTIYLRKNPWLFLTGGGVGQLDQWSFDAALDGTVVNPRLTLEGVRLAAEALP